MSSLTERSFFLSFALAATLSAPSFAAERITKFPVGGGYPTPIEITAGADHKMWFADRYAAAIGRIDTEGNVAHVDVGDSTPGPFGVAAGADGNSIWFTETLGNKIGRIELSSIHPLIKKGLINAKVTEYPLPTAGAYPTVITAGPDGNMWFVELLAHKIGRITPAGVVSEFPTPTPNSYPKAITAGPDGALWFVESEVNKIGRITTDGVITEYPLPHPNSSPYRITAGPDGALWFSEFLGERVGRITVDGQISETYMGAHTWPRGIVAGPDGAIYVALGADGTRRVGRLENGEVTEIRVPLLDDERAQPGYDFTPSKSGNLQGLAFGADGNLWFTESDTGKIGRILMAAAPSVTVTTAPDRH